MKKYIRGSVAVEAAVGIPILIFLVLSWIELCLIFYSINLTEHAFSKAVFEAKKVNLRSSSYSNYKSFIYDRLLEYGGTLWKESTISDSVVVDVNYFNNYSSLLQCTSDYEYVNQCSTASSDYKNMAIAIYSLTYTHRPLISIWVPPMPIKREIITVQEYGRCEFDIESGGSCV